MSGKVARPISLDATATVAMAAYSAVAAIGFSRVFGTSEFVTEVLAIVVVGHGGSFVLRRLGVHWLIAVPLLIAALTWLIAWLRYPETVGLLPTGDTWSLAMDDIGLARDQFRVAVAPVEYIGGWASLACVGTAIAVLLGDTFAFRAEARGEALVPAGVLFVFVAALGSGVDRIGLSAALVLTGFLAAVALRTLFDRPARTTLGRSRGRLAIVAPAACIAASLVTIAAWALGPRLPGAEAQPLYETRGRGGGVTEVISPLVDIRSRLVNRSGALLFDVRASEPVYWRVAALSEFDGQRWQLPERTLEDAEGPLGRPAPGSTENRQRITIAGLESALVPAAADPVEAAGPSLRWSPDTASLVVIDDGVESGDVFDVTSAMPTFTPDQLRGATSESPPDAIFLNLPDDFPRAVRELALDVTGGSATAYGTALNLQDWFRREFEYSLDVPPGHGTSAIEAFLRQRIGYCEQFAGTFAAMMRSLGYPARVAVGFTPGTLQADGSYSVLGRNAHAWPEVWFDGLGWVPFEPTPGRGAPRAQSYTGVAPAQDEVGVDPEGGGQSEEADATDPPSSALPRDPANPGDAPPRLDDFAPSTASDAGGGGGFPWNVVMIVLAVLFVAAWLPYVARRWRRRHLGGRSDQHVAALWDRTVRAVEIVGVPCPPSSTPTEIADAAAPRLAVAARPLRSLADVVTATAYAAPGQFDPTEVRRTGSSVLTDADRWCRQVEEVAIDAMTPTERIRRHFSTWN